MSKVKAKDDVYKELGKVHIKLDGHDKEFAKLNTRLEDQSIELVKLNAKLDEQNEKFVTKEDNHRVLNLVDEVLGEVKAMRQEQAMHTGSHQRMDEELDSYDKRIKKLENSSISA